MERFGVRPWRGRPLGEATMRRRRTELEKFVADVVVKACIEHRPGLRKSIRELLDKGATPSQVRQKYGIRSRLYRTQPATSITIEWVVDEWEREQGRVKADESIDQIAE